MWGKDWMIKKCSCATRKDLGHIYSGIYYWEEVVSLGVLETKHALKPL